MFRRGLALCIALGLSTVVKAQIVDITLVPDSAGPYTAGQQVFVDVNMTLTNSSGDQLVRLAQLDLTDSDAGLLSSATYPPVADMQIPFWDFTSLGNCPGSCAANHFVENILGGDRPNIGSITYLGLSPNANEQILLTEDVPVRIGRMRVVMPNPCTSHVLDVAGSGAAPDLGARVVYGFDTPTSLTVANGGITGGTLSLSCGDGCTDPAVLASSFPASGSTLWRATKNRIRITLDSEPADPVVAGDFEIVEMIAGGTFGSDVSGTFGVTQNGTEVVLQDSASALTNKTWYRVRSTDQNCIDVDVCYLVQAGDASGDKFVNFNDLVNINMSIPTLPANINDTNRRRDTNGDNFINFNDMVTSNGFIPSLGVPVPAGHTCP